MWFRTLVGVSSTRVALGELKALLSGKVSIPGVQLRPRDRWNMVTTLIAQGDPAANEVYESEKQRDHTGDGLKYSYAAAAAKPSAATKKWYFDDYLHNPARPEDWVSDSLHDFNEWNQAELTLPYLRPALDALPKVKQQRKIFFVLGWAGAFIDGQQSPAADAEVHAWLDGTQLDPDLRLKVLEVVDELDRTVKIRQRFP
jgi:aminopeptidase N